MRRAAMRRAAAAAVPAIALIGCDAPPASEPGDGAAVAAQTSTAPAIDWSEVETLSDDDAQEFLHGVVRILDTELDAAAGTVTLKWAPRGAIVTDGGSVEIAWFWPPASPRHRDASPELWKTAVEYVAARPQGYFVTKAMPEASFSDDRRPAHNTAWTFKPRDGSEPVLVVEWRTR